LNGIQLQLLVGHDIQMVRCDPSQVEQVLLALMMNAIDAMPRGGNLWVRAGLADSAEEVAVEVRDEVVSELGKGTAFTITLPVEAATEFATTTDTPFAARNAR
jgi:signal transduction histidine kinase